MLRGRVETFVPQPAMRKKAGDREAAYGQYVDDYNKETYPVFVCMMALVFDISKVGNMILSTI